MTNKMAAVTDSCSPVDIPQLKVGGDRYDAKLDALLRREMTGIEYERVVASEVCIVLFSRSGKRVYGHVILEGTFLSFVSIPLKQIQRLVSLKDVISTAIMNDHPAFLPRKDGENTIHLVIKYEAGLKAGEPNDIITPTTTQPSRHTPPADATTTKRQFFKQFSRKKFDTDGASSPLVETLDIYILKEETPFVSYVMYQIEDAHMCVGYCRDYVTTSIDRHYTPFPYNDDHIIQWGLSNACLSRSKRSNERERERKMTIRFNCLKSEILSAKTIESSAVLYLELNEAVDKYFQLKLLFWQDGYELLNHSIDHVSMMTCNSLPIDQIEYHVVVSQFILKSFQDTLVSKHKLTILTRNNAQMIVKLTTHIFNSIYRLSILGLSHKLLHELVSISACLLFELSRSSQQTINNESCDTVTISWWANICALQPHLTEYMDILIEALCLLMTDGGQVVVIYQVISLMLVLATHSVILLDMFIKRYTEEFQYIITSLPTPTSNNLPLLTNRFNKLRDMILKK